MKRRNAILQHVPPLLLLALTAASIPIHTAHAGNAALQIVLEQGGNMDGLASWVKTTQQTQQVRQINYYHPMDRDFSFNLSAVLDNKNNNAQKIQAQFKFGQWDTGIIQSKTKGTLVSGNYSVGFGPTGWYSHNSSGILLPADTNFSIHDNTYLLGYFPDPSSRVVSWGGFYSEATRLAQYWVHLANFDQGNYLPEKTVDRNATHTSYGVYFRIRGSLAHLEDRTSGFYFDGDFFIGRWTVKPSQEVRDNWNAVAAANPYSASSQGVQLAPVSASGLFMRNKIAVGYLYTIELGPKVALALGVQGYYDMKTSSDTTQSVVTPVWGSTAGSEYFTDSGNNNAGGGVNVAMTF